VDNTTDLESPEQEFYPRWDAAKKRLAATDFAARLYQQLESQEGNLFFSPFSVSVALGMALAGARGVTNFEIARALAMDVQEHLIHESFAVVLEKFRFTDSYDMAPPPEWDPLAQPREMGFFRMLSANGTWIQRGQPLVSQFLTLLKEKYQAEVRAMDFAGSPDICRAAINRWISDKTAGQIRDMLPEGALSSLTRLMLTNAVYFRAKWRSPFMPENTSLGVFHRLDSTKVEVPMIRQKWWFNYAENGGIQMVELPYVGDFSMLILLPRKLKWSAKYRSWRFKNSNAIVIDYLRDVHACLTRETLNERFNPAKRTVELCMPKFHFSSLLSLKGPLVRMGMAKAFEEGEADFSGMLGNRSVFLGDILHRGAVSVDEEGTEAAAATSLPELRGLPSPQVVRMDINRPFVFLIRDDRTGMICFMGRLLDPS
jgi:serpin B